MTVEQNNFSNDQMLGFIRERLDSMNYELDTLQLSFLRYKQVHNLFDAVKQLDNSFLKFTEADKEAVAQQFKLDVANGIDRYLNDKKKSNIM
jgi:hypothetical protein